MTKPRILAIDDDQLSLAMVDSMLSDEFHLDLAKSGAAGLLFAQRAIPDLVLLDIIMPDMDGFETCRQLREIPGMQRVPIIFVTGESDVKTEAAGLSLGAADFIAKPFYVDVVRLRIHNLLERESLRKQLEQQRSQLEEMVKVRTDALALAKETAEAASRAKSIFLANISNNLRTPLHAIMSMTDVALRGSSSDAQHKPLERIADASAQLLTVIDNILDFTFVESGQMSLDIANFRLGALLDSLVEVGRYQAGEKGLDFVAEFEGVSGLELQGDPKRIKQILGNLIENACKFTAVGKVTFRARMLDQAPDAVQLRLEVQDTGVGVPLDLQQRIFSPFERVELVKENQPGGNGLGLAISRRLAKRMGGELGVHSEPGEGSTFWFVVRLLKAKPAAKWASPAYAVAPSFEESLRTRHADAAILLVEDEPINQEATRIVLESAGLRVDVAGDGKEAVELARCNIYSLILMDIVLPKMSGIEAATAIRSNSLNRKTPIIALSANVYQENRMHCVAAGMNDFVAKPVSSQTLYQSLIRWLK